MTVYTPSARVVALDNLRVVAMLLGLVTHGVLPYTATGVIGFPIKDATRHPLADACYLAVHDFRMQLFFLLAGFAAAALAARHGSAALVRNRLARVAGPLLLAVVVVSPALHIVFAGHAATRGIDWNPIHSGGWIGPNFHLWFLYYLLLCCAPLTVILVVGSRIPVGLVQRIDAGCRRIVRSSGTVFIAAAVTVPVLWDMPAWLVDTPKGWLPDLTIYAYYLGYFLAGSVLYRHRDLLPSVGRRWPLQLVVANLVVLPVMLKLTVSGNWHEDALGRTTPVWLVAWKAAAILMGGLYTTLTISALLGIFQRYFAGSHLGWKYLSGASYWCYLAGFPVQALLQAGLAPFSLPILTEFVVVNTVTFAVLLTGYELFVRQTWIGQLLNGRRSVRTQFVEPVLVECRLSAVGSEHARMPEFRPDAPPVMSRGKHCDPNSHFGRGSVSDDRYWDRTEMPEAGWTIRGT